MTERLSTLDASFLYLDSPTTPMHVGTLLTLTPPASGFDYQTLVELIESRIGLVPRYRQKVRTVPARLANPIWIDDPDFDITYHVRRSGLPRPGSDQQLLDFCARIMSRPLDRQRPLWEIYLVEGLVGDRNANADRDHCADGAASAGRIAIVTKTHQALVDGLRAIDIGTVILDPGPRPRRTTEPAWIPEPEPSDTTVVVQAAWELARRPARAVNVVGADLQATLGKAARAAVGLLSAAHIAARPAPSSPLNVPIGAQRRYSVARTSLDDYRRVCAQRGGSVNDVVLATISGALRSWLLFRGEAVTAGLTVRSMVPMSVQQSDGSPMAQVGPYFVDLPVGEPDPLVRLAQIGYAMRAHNESGRSMHPGAIMALGVFASPTLHALGARAAGGLGRRLFNLVITNVPGPQFPLFAAGARLDEIFPIVPLGRGQALSVGLTSYDGGVFYGFTADRDAMPDVDVLASLIDESLAELLGAPGLGSGAVGAVSSAPRSIGRRTAYRPGAQR